MTSAAHTTEMPNMTYRRQGQGHPLVLVHGYLGGAAMWQRQIAALSDTYDVIAPELPGYGDSHGAHAESSIRGYTQDFATCAALGEHVSTETVPAGLTAMETWDGRAALAGMTQHTLIIWGDKDRSCGWQQPEALRKGIPGSNLAVMQGYGHNAHLENPALFHTIIRDFLTDGTECSPT